MHTPDWDSFRRGLLNWYRPERRPMPWKREADPYRVWLSEIILQQTRVEQGRPYFECFVAAFPTVADLAAAEDGRVMKLWEGLGYYSRARNLLRAARMVVADHGGTFPSTYSDLLKLPGIGPYTAAAIASFAFGEPVAVLDGNVFRVLSRYTGDGSSTEGTRGRRHFQLLADRALGTCDPARYNLAIMDFGALVCTPRAADCPRCPLSASCAALATDRVYELPAKKEKARVRDRYFHYLVVSNPAGQTLIRRRDEAGIWRGLHEYPLVETPNPHSSLDDIIGLEDWPEWLPTHQISYERKSRVYRHQLSHQRIHAIFYRFSWAALTGPPREDVLLVDEDRLSEYAVPRLILRYREDRALTFDL
jgi:A/G-specific adenine glycosylase